MKTLSWWLIATAVTVISFFLIMILISGIFEPSSGYLSSLSRDGMLLSCLFKSTLNFRLKNNAVYM